MLFSYSSRVCCGERNTLYLSFFSGSHKKRSITTSDDQAWERRKRDGRRDRVYLWIDRIVPYEIDAQLGEQTCQTQEKLEKEI